MGHIWLIGMMGSGKNTVGARLAERSGLPFYDVDADVEEGYGRSVADVFFMEGEAAFRQMEAEAIERIADLSDGVVATGGGSILEGANVSRMREHGTVVLLDVTAETAAGRIADTDSRPLLTGDALDGLSDILTDRIAAYRAAAEIVIDANDDADTVVGRVMDACGM
jgi:shikimate kinase